MHTPVGIIPTNPLKNPSTKQGLTLINLEDRVLKCSIHSSRQMKAAVCTSLGCVSALCNYSIFLPCTPLNSMYYSFVTKTRKQTKSCTGLHEMNRSQDVEVGLNNDEANHRTCILDHVLNKSCIQMHIKMGSVSVIILIFLVVRVVYFLSTIHVSNLLSCGCMFWVFIITHPQQTRKS